MTAPGEQALRVGVVGCGAVAELYHLPALLASRDVRVAAFVDPVLARAERLAERAGAQLALTDHAQLAGNVDLAIVAVPNALHERVTVDLLDAGIHVLVEKPMARTIAECERMLAASRVNERVLAVGHDFRYFPVAGLARNLFASGMLGRLARVDVKQSAGGRWPSASAAGLTPAAGGGTLMNFGVHILDLLLWWLGDMRVVQFRDNAAGGIETECVCDFQLNDGTPLRFELGYLRTMRDTCIAEGERGSVEIGIHDPAIVRLVPGNRGPALSGTIADPEFEEAPMRTVFARQLADLVAAVRGTGAPGVSGMEAMRAVALVEQCYAIRQPLRRPWDYPEAYAVAAAETTE